jgi:hypothetical protein
MQCCPFFLFLPKFLLRASILYVLLILPHDCAPRPRNCLGGNLYGGLGSGGSSQAALAAAAASMTPQISGGSYYPGNMATLLAQSKSMNNTKNEHKSEFYFGFFLLFVCIYMI